MPLKKITNLILKFLYALIIYSIVLANTLTLEHFKLLDLSNIHQGLKFNIPIISSLTIITFVLVFKDNIKDIIVRIFYIFLSIKYFLENIFFVISSILKSTSSFLNNILFLPKRIYNYFKNKSIIKETNQYKEELQRTQQELEIIQEALNKIKEKYKQEQFDFDNLKNKKIKFQIALDILGIQENYTKQELKKAFHKKSLQYHPDKHKGNETAQEYFKQINNANDFLKNYKHFT